VISERRVLCIVGPTATGKTALGVALAKAIDGEIISCDSTAVYRGIDIGTDKPTMAERQGIVHHLIDVVGPDETYSAARFARDAAAAIHDIHARGKWPIVVGGTGFYYRALVRGLFPGPERNDELRARLDHVASRRGVEALHRWLARVDPASAVRIMPRDLKRLVRALEVYLLTGRPLTAHFDATVSPLKGWQVLTLGLIDPRPDLETRVARRVDAQFARGVVAEVEQLIASGVPDTAHAFSGLVYRQIIEMRHGVRDEPATRALIVRENMRYARRQVMWFRKEPDVRWLSGPGTDRAVQDEALLAMRQWGNGAMGQ
jgi:tRNA dimethylallyltransferase